MEGRGGARVPEDGHPHISSMFRTERWEDAEVHESRKMSSLIYPQCSGRKGWEDAEVHESRKMSTLILRYTREHHMGKYSLRAVNQLGEAECSCDLIVRSVLSSICGALASSSNMFLLHQQIFFFVSKQYLYHILSFPLLLNSKKNEKHEENDPACISIFTRGRCVECSIFLYKFDISKHCVLQ